MLEIRMMSTEAMRCGGGATLEKCFFVIAVAWVRVCVGTNDTRYLYKTSLI